MTVDKNFKRLVRARMAKTGEGYTSARQAILNERAAPTTITVLMARAREAGHDSLGITGDLEASPSLAIGPHECGHQRGQEQEDCPCCGYGQ